MFKKIALHRVFSDRFSEIEKEKKEEVEMVNNAEVDEVLEFQLALLDQIYKSETGFKERIMTVCVGGEDTQEFRTLAQDAANLIGLKDPSIAGKYVLALHNYFVDIRRKEEAKAAEGKTVLTNE
jgi:hypothetical protein